MASHGFSESTDVDQILRGKPGITPTAYKNMTSQRYSAPGPFESLHCVVYAILLDPAVAKESAFVKKKGVTESGGHLLKNLNFGLVLLNT